MMEFLVSNNLNEYFLNVLLMNHFDQLVGNRDRLLMFDINVVQLRIHVQIQARNRNLVEEKKIFQRNIHWKFQQVNF
jgi:hypothetical protein